MDANTITVHEIPNRPLHDTRHSWRAMRSAVVWLCSIVGGVLAYWCAYSLTGPGNSRSEIAGFESSLTAYINAADAAGFSRLGLESEDFTINQFLLAGAAPVTDGEGHLATADVAAASDRFGAAFTSLSYANQNCAQQVTKQAEVIYDREHGRADPFNGLATLTPWQNMAASAHWALTSQVMLKDLGVAAASAVGAWLLAWLAVVALALVWWFVIDRLREIAGAVRGN